MAAHSIAIYVGRDDGHSQWFKVGPPSLMMIVFNDLLVTYDVSRDV